MGSDIRSPGSHGQHARDGAHARGTARSGPSERASTARSASARSHADRQTPHRATQSAQTPALHVEREGEAELQSLRSLDGASEVDEAQRREMIATSAYLRAERRGFDSGSELADWLAAEEEVDAWIRQMDRGAEEPPLFEE